MTSKNGQRTNQVGIDRIIRLRWLEKTAYLVLAGNDWSMIRSTLKEEMANSFRTETNTVRGSLDKTITNLMRIWVRPPRMLQSLHEDGLQLLKNLPPEQRIAVHWGMVMSVYPFWANVASHVGRILRLQESFRLKSIQLRLREQYGQRETVSRSVQRILRSFVDWNVLRDNKILGFYSKGNTVVLTDSKLIGWLIETYLHAFKKNQIIFDSVINAPCLFPFELHFNNFYDLVKYSERLVRFNQGGMQEVIGLKKNEY